MGLFTKVLEITWARPMYMKYIFLCEGGIHLLITGFAKHWIRLDSDNCHLNLSAVCDCGFSWSYSLTFLMSLLLTV